MLAFKDWLPDLQGALTGFYEENLKETLETKTQEFKSLIQNNIVVGQRTQKALISITLGIFFLLLIAYFWKDDQKYLVLGILTGYLTVYVYHLTNLKQI